MNPQPLAALEIANQRRVARAETKRWVKNPDRAESLARCATLLDNPPDHVMGAFVVDVVSWCWKVSPGQADRLIAAHGIGFQRTVRELTERQRRVLAASLRGCTEGREAA